MEMNGRDLEMVRDEEKNELEKFREMYAEWIEIAAEFIQATSDFVDAPIPLDPVSLTALDEQELDSRSFEDLSEEELEAIRETLISSLGINKESSLSRTYKSEAPEESAKVPGEIIAKVFHTNKEGIFLQELTFADGAQRYLLGPDVDI